MAEERDPPANSRQTDALLDRVARSSMTLFAHRTDRGPERGGSEKEIKKRENEDLSYEPVCGLTRVCVKPSEVSTSP